MMKNVFQLFPPNFVLCQLVLNVLLQKKQFTSFLILEAKNFANFGGCDLKFTVAGCER